MAFAHSNGAASIFFTSSLVFTHVQEQTADVRRYFGPQHSVASTCVSGHTTVEPKGEPQTLVPINPFDWREIQRKNGQSCSLSDYFTSATPRVPIGNAEGGTTPVHEFPLACSHKSCKQQSDPQTAYIETAWPLILQISPHPSITCPIPPKISIPTSISDGERVEYVLVGITSYEPRHWTSDIFIGNEYFHYNDLLACLSPQKWYRDKTKPATVLLNYHRTSRTYIVSLLSFLN